MPATHESAGTRPAHVGAMPLFPRLRRRAPRTRPRPARARLENRTGVRIGICFKSGDRCMVLPPFGAREMPAADLQGLELEQWKCRGLVQVHPVCPPHGRAWVISLISLGVWSIPVLGILVLVRPELMDPAHRALWWGVGAFWGLVALVGLVAWITEPAQPESNDPDDHTVAHAFREQLLGGLYRWVGMALVLSIGVGVPGGLLWAQREVLERTNGPVSPVCQLFLGIFATFVAVVSTLPALLFFLFQQQRRESARTTFFREVMRIDRGLQTVTDAEAIYGLAVNEAHGDPRRGVPFNLSLVPVIISTLLMTIGWTAVLLPTLNQNIIHAQNFGDMELATLLKPRRTVFTFAFLGAYFFTLAMVFRRYVRADLGPKAYSHISMRIIAAVVLAWVAAATPQLTDPADPGANPLLPESAQPAALLLVLVFFVGIVPETGMAVIHDVLRAKWNPMRKVIPSLEEKDPLDRLEGITLYDRARLLEEGIENVENLAHHDLIELMLRTRIPTPRVVDLVDQAILYLHVRSTVKDDPEDAMRTLRRIGIRTATDLLEAERRTPDDLLHGFDDTLGSVDGLPRLQMICLSIADDEWIPQLMHWRDTRTRCDEVLELGDFLEKMRTGRHRPARPRVRPPRTAAPHDTAPSRNGAANGDDAAVPTRVAAAAPSAAGGLPVAAGG